MTMGYTLHRSPLAVQALMVIAGLYGVATIVTGFLAVIAGAPFVLWFDDTPILLGSLLTCVLLLGVVWDGLLVSVGLLAQTIFRPTASSGGSWVTVESLRKARFFTCGPTPVLMLLATAFAVLGTSNLTLLSLKLLQGATHWRDSFFWQIEGRLIEHLAQLPINAAGWDHLYHSAWGIEILAAFALIVIGRGPWIVLHYCVSLILLFYIGRLLGTLNPVMGPAFHRPDLFSYLDGSVTSTAMKLVAKVMAQPADQAMHVGGILLGGVSAMPSLHVAMVAATAYWLFTASRWTLIITVAWVLSVWTSTVVLGWHYVLDGAGGIALAGVSIILTRLLLRRLGLGRLDVQAAAHPRIG